jgi:hypothetical protein
MFWRSASIKSTTFSPRGRSFGTIGFALCAETSQINACGIFRTSRLVE